MHGPHISTESVKFNMQWLNEWLVLRQIFKFCGLDILQALLLVHRLVQRLELFVFISSRVYTLFWTLLILKNKKASSADCQLFKFIFHWGFLPWRVSPISQLSQTLLWVDLQMIQDELISCCFTTIPGISNLVKIYFCTDWRTDRHTERSTYRGGAHLKVFQKK